MTKGGKEFNVVKFGASHPQAPIACLTDDSLSVCRSCYGRKGPKLHAKLHVQQLITVKQNLKSKHVAYSQSDPDNLIFDNLGSTVGITMKSNSLNLN